MMSPTELQQTLLRLELPQAEAAQLLGVTPRTLRRWFEGEEVPGPPEQALRAWVKLHERKMAWRPDSATIEDGDQDQIDRLRAHAVDLSELCTRVERRGGVRLPWAVDRTRCCAALGPMEVRYYELPNGSFSLGTYVRKDGDPNVERDRELIDDAAYCIARELAAARAEPVTLVCHDWPWRDGVVSATHKKFPSRDEAIRFACSAMGSAAFHDAFIMAGKPSSIVMDKLALRRECERRNEAAVALRSVANSVKINSRLSARHGANMLSPEMAWSKQQKIVALGDKIGLLADDAVEGTLSYHKFESLLGELHKLGFFPDTSRVSAVARAFFFRPSRSGADIA